MADEIIEIKPGIGPVKLNVRALWRRLTGEASNNAAAMVAQRFLELFEAHGVGVAQIPRFVPGIGLGELGDSKALLSGLTPLVLEQTAQLFGIQRSWLEGTTNRFYRTYSCYKQTNELFRVLKSVRYDRHMFPVRALTTARALDRNSDMTQPLVLLIAEKLAPVEDVDQIWDIDRYHIFGDGWDWSQWTCRVQLKAMGRMLDRIVGERVPLFVARAAELEAVAEGRRVPREFVTRCLLTDPSLEDYSCSHAESAVAKETEELPAVLEYIAAHELETMAG